MRHLQIYGLFMFELHLIFVFIGLIRFAGCPTGLECYEKCNRYWICDRSNGHFLNDARKIVHES